MFLRGGGGARIEGFLFPSIPIIVLVRNGSAIPHIALAQSTKDMDWSKIILKVFATERTNTAVAKVFLPGEDALQNILLNRKGNNFEVNKNTLNLKTTFKVDWLKIMEMKQ
jgi:alpha-D-xyloside xylohydrolase